MDYEQEAIEAARAMLIELNNRIFLNEKCKKCRSIYKRTKNRRIKNKQCKRIKKIIMDYFDL